MKNFLLCFCCLLLYSCKEKALSPNEFIQWVENPKNGLLVEKQIGEYTFQLQYKPVEYIALKELKDIETEDKKNTFQEKVKELAGMEHYNLKIIAKDKNIEMLRVGASSDEEYYNRINYFSTLAQKDFILVEGKDTLPSVLYHFERSYNVAPYSLIVLGFDASDKSKKLQDKMVSYQDEILGVGTVNLTLGAEEIKQLPQIKF